MLRQKKKKFTEKNRTELQTLWFLWIFFSRNSSGHLVTMLVPRGSSTPEMASRTLLLPALWSPTTTTAGRGTSLSRPRERNSSIMSMNGRTSSSKAFSKLVSIQLSRDEIVSNCCKSVVAILRRWSKNCQPGCVHRFRWGHSTGS